MENKAIPGTDTFEELSKKIEKLRGEILFGDAGDVVCGAYTEQYFLLALAALEQAKYFMKIAHIHAMRGD